MVIPPFRPAIFDCDVAAIDPAELAQALQKSPDGLQIVGVVAPRNPIVGDLPGC
jgi:hypothetical protein